MPNLAYNLENLSVLIADDHPHMRKAVKKVVEKLGFSSIHEANDGSVAVDILDEEIIDLALVDLFMPTNGFHVIESIRNRSIASEIPIIVITGEANQEDIVKASDYGADDYIIKPFQANDLEKKIQQAIEKYYKPDSLTQRIMATERLLLQKRYNEATRKVDEILAEEPKSQKALYIKSLAQFRSGKPEEALETLNISIKINNKFFRNHGLKADIMLAQGNKGAAAESMSKELELNSKNTNRQTTAGKLYLELHDFQEAAKHFREALKTQNRHAPALLGMGKLYATQNNLEKAMYYFKRLRRVKPKSTKPLITAVKTALDFGEPKKAEYFLKDEKKQHPEREDTYLVLAKFFISQKDELSAIRTIRDLLIRRPSHVEGLQTLYEIGHRYQKHTQISEILHEITNKPKGTSPDVLQQLAESLIKLGKVTEAIDAATRALPLVEPKKSGRLLALLADGYLQSQEVTKAYFSLLKMKKLGLMNANMNELAMKCEKIIRNRRRHQHDRSA